MRDRVNLWKIDISEQNAPIKECQTDRTNKVNNNDHKDRFYIGSIDMNFSSIALANLLGLAGLCAQIGTGNFANGTTTHFQELPHMPSIEVGYKITKKQNRIELAGLTMRDGFCDFPVKIDMEISQNGITIKALHDQGQVVDMENTDVVNRTLGKLALQINYIQSLALTTTATNSIAA